MKKTIHETIVEQEQHELEQVIDGMFEILLELKEKDAEDIKKWKENKDSGNPDADIRKPVGSAEEQNRLREALNSLYEKRLHLVIEDKDTGKQEKKDVRIGLHGYRKGSKSFIYPWYEPLCQAFSSNNPPEEWVYCDTDKFGQQHQAVARLHLKRNLSLENGIIVDVNQEFPKSEDGEGLQDKFLRELLRRRNSKEFQNIVFSIQERQNEIIQAPENEDLIVQGCAGSGKSMIMLHRLPVLINRAFSSLDFGRMYIITPSEIYKGRAKELFHELELDRLGKSPIGMGTIENYFDRCIGKYVSQYDRSYKSLRNGYGTISRTAKLETESRAYIFSKECINDIETFLRNGILLPENDLSEAGSILEIKTKKFSGSVLSELLEYYYKQYEDVVSENKSRLMDYYYDVRRSCDILNKLKRDLISRKDRVSGSIKRNRYSTLEKIKQLEQSLRDLDPVKDADAYKSFCSEMEENQKTLAKLNEDLELVERTGGYFFEIDNICSIIDNVTAQFKEYIDSTTELSSHALYACKNRSAKIVNEVDRIKELSASMKEPFLVDMPSVKTTIEKAATEIQKIAVNRYTVLLESDFSEIEAAYDGLKETKENIINDTYRMVLDKLSFIRKPRGLKWAIKESPYIYLRVLLAYFGGIQMQADQLVSVDEIQSISLEEMNLIREVNADSVILNLYGDGFQHFEGTKGTDRLKDFTIGRKCNYYEMDINYRNAYRIIQYCNEHFGWKMKSVPGTENQGGNVYVIKNETEFENVFFDLLNAPKEEGLYAVIVKSSAEAEYILNSMNNSAEVFCDLTGDNHEIDPKKWNVLTIEDAKGLEFHTVFAVVGRMTEHEKYVAFTRALDELFVYELPLLEE